MAFFGDGATNTGAFHEALNLGQLWNVPAVFVCEDNHWAESTPQSQHSPIKDLSERAVAFGMTSMKVDGQDVEAVYRTAQKALKHARDGKGPVFVLVETYRLTGHYVGDPQVYRPKEDLRELKQDAGSDRQAARRDRAARRRVGGDGRRGDRARRGLRRVRQERHPSRRRPKNVYA